MKWGLIVLIVVVSFFLFGCEVLDMIGFDEEIAQIVKDENPNACADLKGETEAKTKARQDKCYKQVAFALKRADLCDNVKDTSKQEDCFIDLAEDLKKLELCSKLTKGKDECISKVAIAKEDYTICYDIKGNYKDICFDKIARTKLSVELCKRVETTHQQTACISYIAAEKEDVKVCDEILGNDWNRCINEVAFVTGDPEICKKSKSKDICYSALARKNKDPALCEEMVDDDSADDCLEELAFTTKDPKICLRMWSNEEAYSCVLAFAKEDASVCDLLSGTYKENCQSEHGYTA